MMVFLVSLCLMNSEWNGLWSILTFGYNQYIVKKCVQPSKVTYTLPQFSENILSIKLEFIYTNNYF